MNDRMRDNCMGTNMANNFKYNMCGQDASLREGVIHACGGGGRV